MDKDTHSADALKIVGVVLLSAVVAGGVVFAWPAAASASAQVHDFSVPDASTESGSVSDVRITFTGPTVSWSDTPEPVEEFEVRYYVDGPDGETQNPVSVQCQHDSAPATCGFERSTNETVYLDAESGFLLSDAGWTSDDLVPPAGEEASHTIDVEAEFEVMWDGGSVTESASDTTTLTVTNPNDSADPQLTMEFGEAIVQFEEE